MHDNSQRNMERCLKKNDMTALVSSPMNCRKTAGEYISCLISQKRKQRETVIVRANRYAATPVRKIMNNS